MSDSYKTVKGVMRVKVPVGACRFIATVSPVSTENDAKAFIEEVSRKFSDANHNTYAYKIGFGDKLIRRCSDDGEPASTAGPPMLDVLEKYELTNTVLVGTRYFGGVKLGIGGLVRAYRLCADEGVKNSKIITKYFTNKLVIKTDYQYVGGVINETETVKGNIANIDYSEAVIITVYIREKYRDSFLNKIKNATKGNFILIENR